MSDAIYSYKPAGSPGKAEHISQKTHDQLKAAGLLAGAEVEKLPSAAPKPTPVAPATEKASDKTTTK
jgi:hypothetical protein